MAPERIELDVMCPDPTSTPPRRANLPLSREATCTRLGRVATVDEE